jgi:predicted nucleotide-binding protein
LIHAVLFDESVELPSDYRGVEYIKIDAEGAWKFKLAKEMKAAGLQVDRNKAI